MRPGLWLPERLRAHKSFQSKAGHDKHCSKTRRPSWEWLFVLGFAHRRNAASAKLMRTAQQHPTGSGELGGGGAVQSADSIQFSLAVLPPLCSPN